MLKKLLFCYVHCIILICGKIKSTRRGKFKCILYFDKLDLSEKHLVDIILDDDK